GHIDVGAGTSAVITNSSTGGNVTATNGPAGISLCGDNIKGAVKVSGSTGFVLVGDPSHDACPGDTIGGNVQLSGNTAGVEVSHNTSIGGNVNLTNNAGPGPFPDDNVPEVEANPISGSLGCSGNTPPPGVKNDGQANTVTGSRTGQCAT